MWCCVLIPIRQSCVFSDRVFFVLNLIRACHTVWKIPVSQDQKPSVQWAHTSAGRQPKLLEWLPSALEGAGAPAVVEEWAKLDRTLIILPGAQCSPCHGLPHPCPCMSLSKGLVRFPSQGSQSRDLVHSVWMVSSNIASDPSV